MPSHLESLFVVKTILIQNRAPAPPGSNGCPGAGAPQLWVPGARGPVEVGSAPCGFSKNILAASLTERMSWPWGVGSRGPGMSWPWVGGAAEDRGPDSAPMAPRPPSEPERPHASRGHRGRLGPGVGGAADTRLDH